MFLMWLWHVAFMGASPARTPGRTARSTSNIFECNYVRLDESSKQEMSAQAHI